MRIDSVQQIQPDSKVIFIIRDSRDVFVTAVRRKNSWLLGESKNSIEVKLDYFIKIYKLHLKEVEKVSKDKTLLLIRFEDLIISYEGTITTIIDFSGLSRDSHDRKFTNLIRSDSVKTIGIHKMELDSYQISLINDRLLRNSDYLSEYILLYLVKLLK